MKEVLIRFLAGGVVVSFFAVLGDLFKPRSFAGLFGAAPSVALATLGLVVGVEGKLYAATEARSMMAGAVALFIYAVCLSRVIARCRWSVLLATSSLISVWLAAAFGCWLLFLR